MPPRQPRSTRATRPALHIMDVGTRFNAAIFIEGENSTEMWNSFLRAWSCLYVGMSSSLLFDQGSVFMSGKWRYACELNQIELVPTGTGSHNSLHIVESYHAYFRRLYNKVHNEFPRIPDQVTLAIAVKAINDTTGPKDFVLLSSYSAFFRISPRRASATTQINLRDFAQLLQPDENTNT